MKKSKCLVITSIASPNAVLKSYAKLSKEKGIHFYVIGDTKSPKDFKLEGCDYYDVDRQKEIGGRLSRLLPYKHYGRKNLGYLLAWKSGAELLFETDDDNYPEEKFFEEHPEDLTAPIVNDEGWFNVYSFFTEETIWPRGFPLESLQTIAPRPSFGTGTCPIQQGLADGNPDVDAVFRLTRKLPLNFEKDKKIILGKGTWCPFNSQNTIWYRKAFPLLYLPSYCSFRMTDIWRSFVAQRIAWENGWSILFYSPTVTQDRNEHDLLRDFADEIPGYLNNHNICKELGDLKLEKGEENIGVNLIRCYERMIQLGLVGEGEGELIRAWVEDLQIKS